MNPIEELDKYIRHEHPTAITKLIPPLHADGIWSLDIDMADRHLAVEWSPSTSFGISSLSDGNYAEGPDEILPTLKQAETRIERLLSARELTSPPAAVLLRRMRELRGWTQQDLATKLGISQATVSGIESREDIQLSTLQRVIDALGGSLEVFGIFSDAQYRIVVNTAELTQRPPIKWVPSMMPTSRRDSGDTFSGLRSAGSLVLAQGAARTIKTEHMILNIP